MVGTRKLGGSITPASIEFFKIIALNYLMVCGLAIGILTAPAHWRSQFEGPSNGIDEH
jgi:hypothetical protein